MVQTTFPEIDAFWEAHGDAHAWNFVTTDLHNGDLYMFLAFLRPFRQFCAQGRPIRVLAVTRPHHEIASIFADVIDDLVYTPDARFGGNQVSDWRVITGHDRLQPGLLINMFPLNYFRPPLNWGALWFLFNERGIFFIHVFKFLLGLQLDIAPDMPVATVAQRDAAAALFAQHGLPEGRSLLLFPYAKSQPFMQDPQQSRVHFAALAAAATAAGLQVYTSVAGAEEPIEGTTGIFIPFSLLSPFAELAGYAVVLRSGISDILSTATCRKTHIYPSQGAADSVSPLASGYGGVEQNLGFDLIRKPDPAAFADTVLASLLHPDPADASRYIPRHIRNLLAVPLGGGERNGRFRHTDLIIAHDTGRLFPSGVLAEGWSAPEDWGVWTLGYRSILYLQAPVPYHFDPDAVADRTVTVLVDMRFAIAPGTHEVLEYAIEVNDQLSWHEARWPDRYRIIRVPLPPSALRNPVRITLTMRNPVTSKVLSGGQNNDNRLLGIGLTLATYEVA